MILAQQRNTRELFKTRLVIFCQDTPSRFQNMNHYQILAGCSEEQVCHLGTLVLQAYAASKINFLSGPQRGLVMLRVRETVADSQFNAGEILVTEVKLELDG